MTYLDPLFFKFYIISANSIQIERFIPVSQLHLIENYPSANGLSFRIFLTLSEFPIAKNKKVVTKFFFLTTFTPVSLSACLSLFTFCCGINYSLINCFLYTYSFKICFSITIFHFNRRKNPILLNFLYKIATIFLFLVVVSNMSLLNPGPECQERLSCFFHNVQGFINLNSIAKQSPDLNITKVMEFQAYVFEKNQT